MYEPNSFFSEPHIADVWKWTESPDHPTAIAIRENDGTGQTLSFESPDVISKKQNIIALHTGERSTKLSTPSIAPKKDEKNITKPHTYSIPQDDSVTARVRHTAKPSFDRQGDNEDGPSVRPDRIFMKIPMITQDATEMT